MREINAASVNSVFSSVDGKIREALNAAEFKAYNYGAAKDFLAEQTDNFFSVTEDEENTAALTEAVREVDKGCIVSASDRKYRNKTKEIFNKNLTAAVTAYNIARLGIDNSNMRAVSGLMNNDITPAAVKENQRIHRIFTSGTKEEKKAEAERLIEQIGNTDISGMDLSDDRAFAENLPRYLSLSTKFDTENVLKLAKENGVDLTRPRFAEYCKKAEMFSEMVIPINLKMRLMELPSYEAVDLNRLSPEGLGEILDSQNEFSRMTAKNIENVRLYAGSGSPALKLLDGSKPLKERNGEVLELSQKKTSLYADSVNALAGKEPYHRLIDTPDGFFARESLKYRNTLGDVDYSNIKTGNIAGMAGGLIGLFRMQQEYTALAEAGNAPKGKDFYLRYNPEKIKAVTELNSHTKPGFTDTLKGISRDEYELLVCGDDKTKETVAERIQAAAEAEKAAHDADPRAYYKAKLLKNIEKIRTEIPGFTMSEEEIEAKLSPERIQRHEKALAVKNSLAVNSAEAQMSPDCALNGTFSRIAHFLMKPGTEPGAKEYNDELLRKLSSPDAEGDSARRNTFIYLLNETNSFSPSDVTGKTEEELFDFAVKNYRKSLVAFDIGNTVTNAYSSGFRLNDNAREKMERQLDYLVKLGSISSDIVNAAANEEFLTFPKEKLTVEQAAMLMNSSELTLKNAGKDYINNLNSGVNTEYLTSNADLTGIKYTAKDIEDTVPENLRVIPDCAALRREFASFRSKLKSADHFYNFNNSDEYRNVLSSLEKADKVLEKITGNFITPEMGETLNSTISDVCGAANKYHVAKDAGDANSIRAERIELTKGLEAFCKRVSSLNEPACLNPALNAFIKCANADFERKAQNAYAEYVNAPAPDKKTANSERLYENAVLNTQAEREKAASFHKGYLKGFCLNKAVEAREELLGLIDKKKFSVTEARNLMAEIITYEKFAARPGADRSLSSFNYNKESKALAEDPVFEKLTRKISVDNISSFLNKDASKLLADKFKELSAAATDKNAEDRKAEETFII